MKVEYIGDEDDNAIQNIFNIACYDHKRSVLFCPDWKQATKTIVPKLCELLRKQSDDLLGDMFFSLNRRLFEFYNGSTLKVTVLKNRGDCQRYQGSMFDAALFYDAQKIHQEECLNVLCWLRTTYPHQHCESYLYYRNHSDKTLRLPDTLAS